MLDKPRRVAVAAWILAAFAPFAAAQNYLFVDDDAAPGGDGTSWASPLRHLADALAFAAYNPHISDVHVAQGTYRPDRGAGQFEGDRHASFRLPWGVHVSGGWAGPGATDPWEGDPERYPTILTGDLRGDDDGSDGRRVDNSHHVLRSDVGWGQLSGCMITGGCANDSGFPGYYGGGLLSDGGGLSISNCVFRDNCAQDDGGAIYQSSVGAGYLDLWRCVFESNRALDGGAIAAPGQADVSVRECTFIGNTSNRWGGQGGALAVSGDTVRIADCWFEANAAFNGGALGVGGSVRVERCTFTNNRGRGGQYNFYGGAVTASGDATLIDCLFVANQAPGASGGAIGVQSPPTKLRLFGCRFFGNSADYGGALRAECISELVNCVFSSNDATYNGGGAYLEVGSAAARLVNCTFWGNSTGGNGGGIYADDPGFEVRNCILWGNASPHTTAEADQFYPVSYASAVDYSVVEGLSTIGGLGNRGSDPHFLDPPGPDGVPGTTDDDLRLRDDSPAIDAGNTPALPADSFDLDGDSDITETIPFDAGRLPRRRNYRLAADSGVGPAPIVDIGALERSRPGDLNCDGRTDFFDIDPFLLLLFEPASYAAAYPACDPAEGDFNDDGTIDFFDVDPFVATLLADPG